MGTYKDITGESFGRLTAIRDVGSDKGKNRLWLFNCSCGGSVEVQSRSVRNGNTKSCGCLKREVTSQRMTTHGLTKDKLSKKVYIAWNDIKRRCYDENHNEYKRYGALGITLQDSWLDDPVAFRDYVSALPNFSSKMSIDRVDNDLGYKEGNLRWATDAQQTRNQGKQENNTSGFSGVTWYENATGGTRAIAWWYVGEKAKSKSFSEKKHGLLPAFAKACEYRTKMIAELNASGYDYSDKHGK